jgi:ubiquinone/menaquinone biosynthesis C-methylase UbiE
MFRTLDEVLQAWERGSLSSPLALMEMLLVAGDAAVIESEISQRALLDGRNRYSELLRFVADHRQGAALVTRVAADDGPLRDVADVRDMFDRAVTISEEASVALYSLGSAVILEQATREIVEHLQTWSLVGEGTSGRNVLDFGCGTGRLSVALAPLVARATGVDLSPKMIEVARRRAAGIANTVFAVSEGWALPFPDASFDLVVAVDSMPYVVGLGAELLRATAAEMTRALRPDGDWVIFNFSYREDPHADSVDVAELAERHGFDVRENGVAPFTLWNARAFWLRRRPTSP